MFFEEATVVGAAKFTHALWKEEVADELAETLDGDPFATHVEGFEIEDCEYDQVLK